jgi:hypothetical protein
LEQKEIEYRQENFQLKEGVNILKTKIEISSNISQEEKQELVQQIDDLHKESTGHVKEKILVLE